jgi:peptidyl-prolyl cis-trans isomerase C
LNSRHVAFAARVHTAASRPFLRCALAVVIGALALAACGSKDAKPGQSLVRVGDAEVTVHQLNDELARLDRVDAAARKEVLDGLIDRQLLQGEATRAKLDRGPEVMQAIERAKAQILAQAYLKSKLASIGKPTTSEVEAYFRANPALFSQRKVFELKELLIASKDFNERVQAAMDAAKSADEMAAWLDAHNVQYGRRQATRNTAEMPLQMTAKLQAMQKGQSFIVKQSDRSLLAFINDIQDNPVTLAAAEQSIEQFLTNQKRAEVQKAELARLRAATKIDYLDPELQAGAAPKAAPQPAKPVAAAPDADPIARGVAGLK